MVTTHRPQFHGIDWLAMCLTFTAICLLGSKRRGGFLVMNVRGFAKWGTAESGSAKPDIPKVS